MITVVVIAIAIAIGIVIVIGSFFLVLAVWSLLGMVEKDC